MAGQREARAHCSLRFSRRTLQSVVMMRTGLPLSLSLGRGKNSLVAWLLCFSDLQLELQYLSLGFHYLFYTQTKIFSISPLR